MPRLYVLSGPDLGETHDFEETVVLGRARDIGVPLRGKSISRRHAQLALEGGRWVLTDLGSANGTWLGPKRLKDDEWLEDGDEFKLGEIELRFRAAVPDEEVVVPQRAPASPGQRSPAAQPAAPEAQPRPQPEPAPPKPQPADLELEGDWSDEPAAPSLPLRAAPQPQPTPAPTRPRSDRAATSAARRASALGATRAAAPSMGNQRVLQFKRVTHREGFFAADLEQQPGWLRWGLYLIAFALFAALAYGAFHLTTQVREARSDDASLGD